MSEIANSEIFSAVKQGKEHAKRWLEEVLQNRHALMGGDTTDEEDEYFKAFVRFAAKRIALGGLASDKYLNKRPYTNSDDIKFPLEKEASVLLADHDFWHVVVANAFLEENDYTRPKYSNVKSVRDVFTDKQTIEEELLARLLDPNINITGVLPNYRILENKIKDGAVSVEEVFEMYVKSFVASNRNFIKETRNHVLKKLYDPDLVRLKRSETDILRNPSPQLKDAFFKWFAYIKEGRVNKRFRVEMFIELTKNFKKIYDHAQERKIT